MAASFTPLHPTLCIVFGDGSWAKFHYCTCCWGLSTWFHTPVVVEVTGRPEFSDLDEWVNIFGIYRNIMYSHSYTGLFMWTTSVRSTRHTTVKVFSWYSHMNNFVLNTLMKCLRGQCRTVFWAHYKCIHDYTVQPVSQTHFCSSLIRICTCKEMSEWVSNRTHISLVPSLAKSIRQIGCSKD